MTQVDLRVRLDARGAEEPSRRLSRSFDRLGREAQSATDRLSRMESGFDRLKRTTLQLAPALGLIFSAGALGHGIQQSTRDLLALETAMAEVSTLTPDASGIDALTESVRDMAEEFGRAPTDQAQALYQIISAGASDAATATGLLDAANRLAIGGVTDVATAADGLTSILNAYGPAVGSAADVSDALFVSMRAGKTTVEQLSSSIGQVAPIAAQAGVSLEEVLAATSALTKGGIETSTAMRGLRQIIASVVKPSSEAQEMAAQLGVEFNAAALESQGLAAFLQGLTRATGGSTEQLAQLFGGVESLVPVLALAGGGAADFEETLAQMANRAGATEEAFKRMSETMGFRIKQLQQEFGNWRQEQVENLVPAMELVIDNADGLVIVGTTLAALYGTRLVTSIVGSTTAKLATAAASKRAAVAELEAAVAAQANAVAQFRGAQANLASAVAAGRARDAYLLQAQAARALAASNLQLASAQAAVATTTGALVTAGRGLLALVGGPLGVAVLALGGAWLHLSRLQREAAEAADQVSASLDRAGQEMSELSQAALQATVDNLTVSLYEQAVAATEATAKLKELRSADLGGMFGARQGILEAEATAEIERANREVERLSGLLAAAKAAMAALRAEATAGAEDGLGDTGDQVNETRLAIQATTKDIGRVNDAIAATEKRIADLEFAAPFERSAEALDKLNERLDEQRQHLEDLRVAQKAYVDAFLEANRVGEATSFSRPIENRSLTPFGSSLDPSPPRQGRFAAMGIDLSGLSVGVGDLAEEASKLQIADQVARSVSSLAGGLDLLPASAQNALRGVSDIIGGLSSIGAGGTLGAITGAAGLLGGAIGLLEGLFGGGGPSPAEAEHARILEQNNQRLQELADALRESSRTASGFRGLGDQAAAARAAVSLTAADLGDPERLNAIFANAPWAPEGALERALEALGVSLSDLEALAREAGVEIYNSAGQLIPSALQALGQAAELLAQQVEQAQEAFNQDLELRRLEAEGATEAADARRRELEVIEAQNRGFDEATIAALEYVQALEAQAAAAQEAANARASFESRFESEIGRQARRQAEGDPELLRALGEADIARALAEFTGVEGITEEMLVQLAAVMRDNLNAEIEALENSLEEAAEAARKAAEAERFRAMMDEENLRVRLLVAQGRDLEALQMRQQLELLQALHDERSGEYIRLLQLVHAEELRQASLRDQQRTIEETTRGIQNMSRALNAPAGLRLSLLRWRAELQGATAGGFGGPGAVGADVGRFFAGPIVNAASGPAGAQTTPSGTFVTQTHSGNVVVNVYPAPGREGEAVAEAVKTAWQRQLDAGHPNPAAVFPR